MKREQHDPPRTAASSALTFFAIRSSPTLSATAFCTIGTRELPPTRMTLSIWSRVSFAESRADWMGSVRREAREAARDSRSARVTSARKSRSSMRPSICERVRDVQTRAREARREKEETHPSVRSGVGAQDLLNAGSLLEKLCHRTLILGNLPARLELLARRLLESVDEHVPDTAVKGVPCGVEVVAVAVDGNGGDVLELRGLGEGERVGEHGGLEGDDGDAEGAGAEVVNEMVGRLGREGAGHGVIDGGFEGQVSEAMKGDKGEEKNAPAAPSLTSPTTLKPAMSAASTTALRSASANQPGTVTTVSRTTSFACSSASSFAYENW